MKTIIDLSGLGGLAPQYYNGDQNLKILGKENQIAEGFCNPYYRIGVLYPASQSFASVTNPIGDTVKATQVDSINSDGYFYDDDGIIKAITDLDGTNMTNKRAVASTSGTDLEIYTVNGIRQLFYSYRKTGGGNIGIYNLDTVYDDDWLENACANGFKTGATNNVKMIVADNGFMYVLDGASVHKIDGTTGGGANGTATANVLLFPANFQLIDGIDIRGNMWIALIQSSRDLTYGVGNVDLFTEVCGVYVWDRQSTQVNMTDFIPIDGIKEISTIFTFRGIPACFTVSSNRLTQLRIYDGNEFKIVEELETNSYPRFPDSVHVTGNLIMWVGNNGYIYSYGKAAPGFDDALYLIGDITGQVSAGKTFSVAGAILGVGETDESYYLNLKDSTPASLIKRWRPYSGLSGLFPLAGNVFSMVKALPKLSTVNSITLYYPPTATTTPATEVLDIDIYFNQSVTSWGTTTLTRADGGRSYKYIPVGKMGVNFVQLKLTWKIANAMNFAITPFYAEVDYTEGTKKF